MVKIESRTYTDWFGSGDTKDDIKEAIKKHGKPVKLFIEEIGHMVALVYKDKVVCVGYDGNEYFHEFVMEKEIK